MHENTIITYQRFLKTGLSSLSSQDLQENHILSIAKETNRQNDEFTYYVDEKGLFWLTKDDVPQKIYIQGEECNGISREDFEKVRLQHPSETALDNAEFDYVINNDGTISELIDKMRNILIENKLIKNK